MFLSCHVIVAVEFLTHFVLHLVVLRGRNEV